jgi:aspartyl-tRNA(Asn)/glutamyl-tRNA(Gln) amidotransferase subunit C
MEDAEAMYRNWASDDEVTKYLTWPTHESEATTKAVLKDWIENYEKSDSYYTWCIESKEIGEAIGSISVVSSNPKVGAVEIGYCISEAYWHQGITSEAFAAVIKFLHEEVGVRRIESRHDPKNPYSGKVMEKCGLKYEGTRKQADWNNSGICDAAMYGIVYEDAVAAEEEEEVYVAPKMEKKMGEKNVISDETIEYVGILAKLELSDAEKEQAKKDMGEMLDYIDKLNELDTTGVEPMSHIFPVNNVFREDVVTNGDGSEATLRNAPSKKDNGFKVPRTIA